MQVHSIVGYFGCEARRAARQLVDQHGDMPIEFRHRPNVRGCRLSVVWCVSDGKKLIVESPDEKRVREATEYWTQYRKV